ncbi:carotenoid 1,2-hydratase [Shewanella sp. Choline-02u-19]|uniref:lipocalin-like domain-containing protein n=1 Tax=unclassified Shewanella TaxID=196818 RepID=UPI000C32DF0A|nr:MULTISPECIES: lipocalin-like domain-containing protein [unclassified Shewanella]PKH55597.1 carotenoid 1,2-hydratase [Shewanella sp. Bg11-22]PKI29929.1 carotenoid 1,2-hydratase [Shewanella sp. Choline-02u-19]
MNRVLLSALLISFISVFITACSPAASPSTGMGQLLDGNAQGYTPVTPNVSLQFPADHMAHNDFRQEWWYLTANLETESKEQVGLQWTQFRIALSPPSAPPAQQADRAQLASSAIDSSPWQTKQLYMSHTAVTSKSSHKAEEKWSRGHQSIAGTQAEPLTIRQDDWQWRSQSKQLFPATLNVASSDFSYQLQLDTTAPFQLQGDNGYSVKNAAGSVASYYYSQPFITVTGSLVRDGKREKVSGHAWLDREWSSQFLSKTQQGWDWFAIRLDSTSTLMLFQLRDDTGDQSHFYSGRRMYQDGRGHNISNQQITMTATAWQQTPSGRYPVQWHIQIPSENIDITTTPLNNDSSMPLSIPYWEGPIDISGTHNGTGYMELTGY